jgi:hypothetical protein
MGSESAKDLANVLNIKRVKPDGGYVPKIGHTVINWGSGSNPNWIDTATRRNVTILNKPTAVRVASNKLSALTKLRENGIAVPEFTTSMAVADRWLDDGATVVERHVLNGNSAEGVRIVNLDDPEMPSELRFAPLYTKFIPKSREFRIHVFRGKVIDYVEKKKMSSDRRPENYNKYICSNELGWVFCRSDVRDISEVRQIAINAVRALGLDFGAVDVVYYEGTPYVLEVNTAPGIMGTTLNRYVNTFREFLGLPALNLADETVSTSVGSIPTGSSESIAPVTSARPTSFAAPSALVEENVTLTIDRATARKLQALLSQIL